MAKYKVRILSTAQDDMRDIVEYINTLSPDAAFRLYDEIVEGIGSLNDMPMRCGLLKTPELRMKGYRALHISNYLVFFVVLDDVVQIRRILYSKRQFESLL